MASAHLSPCQQQGDRLSTSIPPQPRLTKSQPNLQLDDRSTPSIEKNTMGASAHCQLVGLEEDKEVWQERCMILVRERHRRHQYIEKLKKKVNTLEYQQHHFIRICATDDISELKELRNELQMILEGIKVEKAGNEAVLRKAANFTTSSPLKAIHRRENRSANRLVRPFSTMFSSIKHEADYLADQLIPPRRTRSMNPKFAEWPSLTEGKDTRIDSWRRLSAVPELLCSHDDTQTIFFSANFHERERQLEPRRHDAPLDNRRASAIPLSAVSASQRSYNHSVVGHSGSQRIVHIEDVGVDVFDEENGSEDFPIWSLRRKRHEARGSKLLSKISFPWRKSSYY
ncbi:hypothetical protein I309_05132 [Cryptococcus deuterogattii LA55]|nr:hypothetical protein I309_05132 [Cryptococcus deuterogattii LA55]KIR91106.1 hypothetical protein I304_05202 [Cryptococcus deuterogattii CBS 10090]